MIVHSRSTVIISSSISRTAFKISFKIIEQVHTPYFMLLYNVYNFDQYHKFETNLLKKKRKVLQLNIIYR